MWYGHIECRNFWHGIPVFAGFRSFVTGEGSFPTNRLSTSSWYDSAGRRCREKGKSPFRGGFQTVLNRSKQPPICFADSIYNPEKASPQRPSQARQLGRSFMTTVYSRHMLPRNSKLEAIFANIPSPRPQPPSFLYFPRKWSYAILKTIHMELVLVLTGADKLATQGADHLPF